METDPLYYTQDLEPLNVADLLTNVSVSLDTNSMAAGALVSPLVGIVSEEDGGIIGYAIGDFNAQRIVRALTLMDEG